uniref:Tyrosine-protein phosphatase domain-containing protein n=1 Tax=Parascaris univalens TaxID=6257 RepID=A0A915B5N2_PARUN
MKYAVARLGAFRDLSDGRKKRQRNPNRHFHGMTLSEGGNVKNERYSQSAKQAMRKWVVNLSQGGIHQLRLDFSYLRGYVPNDATMAAFKNNPDKCRYKDVKCWDRTRVVLNWPPNNGNDFIHANWIKHELLENIFICCQAPTEKTVVDFWRMIWQERVKEIIMLCRLKEGGREKCYEYWPQAQDETMTYKPLIITTKLLKTTDPDFIYSRIELRCGDEIRRVQHHQWTTWPDKSVPKTPLTPFRLLRFAHKSAKYPTVVHCSAGVGRSGTFIMIEILLNALKRGLKPDLKRYVKEIRSQRSQVIQAEEQYVYIHFAVAQFLWLKNVVSAQDIKGFTTEYANYIRLLESTNGVLPIGATSFPAPGKAITECGPPPLGDLPEKNEDSSSSRRRRKSSTKGRRFKMPSENETKRSTERIRDEIPSVQKKENEEAPNIVMALDGGAVGRSNFVSSILPDRNQATPAMRGPFGEQAAKESPSKHIPVFPGSTTPAETMPKPCSHCGAVIRPIPQLARRPSLAPSQKDIRPLPTPAPNAPIVGTTPAPQNPLQNTQAVAAATDLRKFVYTPPKYYTVKTAGSQKAILFERKSTSKFVKVANIKQQQQQHQIQAQSKAQDRFSYAINQPQSKAQNQEQKQLHY